MSNGVNNVPLLRASPFSLIAFCHDVVLQNLPFANVAQAISRHIHDQMNRQQACPFPLGVVTLVSGDVTVVHLIRDDLKAVLALVADRLLAPSRAKVVDTLTFELNPWFGFCVIN